VGACTRNSRLWRHRVTWRHQWRHHSNLHGHFPIDNLICAVFSETVTHARMQTVPNATQVQTPEKNKNDHSMICTSWILITWQNYKHITKTFNSIAYINSTCKFPIEWLSAPWMQKNITFQMQITTQHWREAEQKTNKKVTYTKHTCWCLRVHCVP